MKRCYHCKKLIWFWQNQYLGTLPAHAICDSYAFWRDAVKDLGPDAAIEQARKRDAVAYTRSLL